MDVRIYCIVYAQYNYSSFLYLIITLVTLHFIHLCLSTDCDIILYGSNNGLGLTTTLIISGADLGRGGVDILSQNVYYLCPYGRPSS